MNEEYHDARKVPRTDDAEQLLSLDRIVALRVCDVKLIKTLFEIHQKENENLEYKVILRFAKAKKSGVPLLPPTLMAFNARVGK